MTNFMDILNVQSENLVRPKPIAEGLYRAVVTKMEQGNSKNKGTPYLRFMEKLVQAIDVDESNGPVDLSSGPELRDDYYLTEKSLYRLDDYLRHCGFPANGRTIKERLQDMVSQLGSVEVGVIVTRTPDAKGGTNEDGSPRTFANVAGTKAL